MSYWNVGRSTGEWARFILSPRNCCFAAALGTRLIVVSQACTIGTKRSLPKSASCCSPML